MLDRALRQTYPPGSTFKIVTAAAALESGRVHAGHARSTTAPQLDLPQTDAPLPNFDGRPCSTAATRRSTDALMRSCNTAFGKIGLELGDDALREQAEKFGFNQAVRGPDAQRRELLPGGPQPAADRAVGHRPVRRAGDPAADGDGGRRDRPTAVC